MRASTVSLFVLLAALPAAAQTPGRWLDTFAVPGPVTEAGAGAVLSARPDGDGVLVTGQFQRIGSIEADGVVRWTGSAWERFPGTFGEAESEGTLYPPAVLTSVRDAGGDLWVGGRFGSVVQADGRVTPLSGVARLRNGRWEHVGGADDGRLVRALALHDGEVVAGGDFESMVQPDGTVVQTGGVARWTGTGWTGLGRAPATYALTVLPSGGLVAGGFLYPFADAAGVSVPETDGLARWDGAAWHAVGRGLSRNAIVSALGVWNGQLYVGGGFDGFADASGQIVASPSAATWDGAAWHVMGGGVSALTVATMVPDGDRGVLIGGFFSGARQADGAFVASRGVVRWTGSAYEAVPFGVEGDPYVRAVASDGGRMLIGGSFGTETGSGNETRRSAGLVTRASAEAPFLPVGGTGRDGLSGRASEIAFASCGRVWVTGERFGARLTSFGTAGESAIAAWDGTAWRPTPDGLRGQPFVTPDGSASATVNALAPVPGACSEVVVAGGFSGTTGAGGEVASMGIVRWDGQAWQPLGRGTNGAVYDAAFDAAGTLYVAGDFTQVRQSDGTVVAARGVARWTAAGGWDRLGRGLYRGTEPTGAGYSLLIEPGGSVVVGGRFDRVANSGGVLLPAAGVARWTGAQWETFGGITDVLDQRRYVGALATWNGRTVVGGAFESVVASDGTVTESRNVAAWNGTAWEALPGEFIFSSQDAVFAVEAVGGELFAAGAFAGGVVRWNGAAFETLDSGISPDGSTLGRISFASDPAAGRLYAAGGFTSAGDQVSPGLAVYDLDGVVSAEAPADAPRRGLAVWPNPARGSATLRFTLDAAGPARVVLLDMLGRTVATLADGERAAGDQTLAVDASRLPAGVYALRLDAGGETRTQRLTVVR